MDHNTSPVEARPASEAGALPHFASVCSCGLVMANTIKVNVDLDVRQHIAYAAAVAAGPKAFKAYLRGAG